MDDRFVLFCVTMRKGHDHRAGKRRRLSNPRKLPDGHGRGLPLVELHCDDRRGNRKTDRSRKREHLANQQLYRNMKDTKIEAKCHLKSLQQPPTHISAFLSTSMSSTSALYSMPATNIASYCQDCATHLLFPSVALAVGTVGVPLTDTACHVYRQRGLLMDPSPMTHTSICDPKEVPINVTVGTFT